MLQNLRNHIFFQTPQETDTSVASSAELSDDQGETEPLIQNAGNLYPDLTGSSLLTVDVAGESNDNNDANAARADEKISNLENMIRGIKNQLDGLTVPRPAEKQPTNPFSSTALSNQNFQFESPTNQSKNQQGNNQENLIFASPTNQNSNQRNFYFPSPTNQGVNQDYQNFSSPHHPNNNQHLAAPTNQANNQQSLEFPPNPDRNYPSPQLNTSPQAVSLGDRAEGTLSLSKLSQQATLALTSIHPFSGEKPEEHCWADFKREICQTLNLYVTQNPGTSNKDFSHLLASCLKSRLTKSALRHAHNQPTEISDDYKKLLEALSARFAPPLNISIIQNELSSLEQKEISVSALDDKINSLVKKYINADKSLANKSFEQKDAVVENIKRQALHTSLRSDIFAEVVKSNKLGEYTTMLECAKEVEANFQILKSRADGSKQSRSARILKVEASPEQQPREGNRPSFPRPNYRNRYKPPENNVYFSNTGTPRGTYVNNHTPPNLNRVRVAQGFNRPYGQPPYTPQPRHFHPHGPPTRSWAPHNHQQNRFLPPNIAQAGNPNRRYPPPQ